MWFHSYLLLPCLFAFVAAGVEVTQPCLSGDCTFLTHSEDGTYTAQVHISGSPDAISDVSRAAGWEPLDCDHREVNQTMRMVCLADDGTCNHLHNGGVPGTVVRLPVDCAGDSFIGFVVKATPSKDQSVPEHIKARLRKREEAGGSPRDVVDLTITDTWSGADPHGPVYVKVYASTAGFDDSEIKSVITRRSADPEYDVKEFELASRGVWNVEPKAAIPVSVNRNVSFFDTDPVCVQYAKVSVSSQAEVQADAKISFGVAMTGSIVPPRIKSFALYAGISADIVSRVKLKMAASGVLDSGDISIFEAGLPGMSLPGILTVGPMLKLGARATASLNLDMDLDVTLKYKVDQLKGYLPQKADKKSSGSIYPADTPLSLSVTEKVEAAGNVEVRIFLRLQFGISAFRTLTGSVYLGLDGFGKVNLDVKQQAIAAISTVDLMQHPPRSISPAEDLSQSESKVVQSSTGTDVVPRAFQPSYLVTTKQSSCIDFKIGMDANIGASGKLSFLGQDEARHVFWSDHWAMYNGCTTSAHNVSSSVLPPGIPVTQASPNTVTTTAATPSPSAPAPPPPDTDKHLPQTGRSCKSRTRSLPVSSTSADRNTSVSRSRRQFRKRLVQMPCRSGTSVLRSLISQVVGIQKAIAIPLPVDPPPSP